MPSKSPKFTLGGVQVVLIRTNTSHCNCAYNIHINSYYINLLQNKTKSLVSHNSKFRKYNFGGTGAAQRSSVISVVLSGKEEGCSAQAGWAGGEGAGGRYWAREGRRHTALEDATQSDLNVRKTL